MVRTPHDRSILHAAESCTCQGKLEVTLGAESSIDAGVIASDAQGCLKLDISMNTHQFRKEGIVSAKKSQAHGPVKTSTSNMSASMNLDDDPEIINKPNDNEEEVEEQRRDNDSGSESESSSESDSSGEEDEEDTRKKTKKRFDRIIADLKASKDNKNNEIRSGNFNLNDHAQLSKFLSLHGSHLSKKSTKDMNLLHLIAEEDKGELPSPGKMSALIEALVRLEGNLLAQRDDNGKTPLFCAVANKNRKLVRAMCDAHDDVNSVLKITKITKNPTNARSTNCVHKAISKKSSSKDDELVRFLIDRADSDTLLALDEDGLTPLHLAVEYKRCDEGQIKIVETLVARCDKALDKPYKHTDKGLMSPYLYLEYTHEQAKQKERLAAEAKRGSDKPKSKEDALRSSHGEKDDNSAKRADSSFQEQRSSLMMRPQISGPSRTTQRPGEAPAGKFPFQPSIPDRNREPVTVSSSLESSNKNNPRTPITKDRESEKDRGKKSSSSTAKKSKLKPSDASAERIKEFLKLYYLRNRQHDDAVEFLYGVQQDKQIYFDLIGIPSKITKDRIENGLSHLAFEDVLQYVAIPHVQFEDHFVVLKAGQRAPNPDGSSRFDMKLLFNWLRDKKGVKRILRVIVEDLQHPAHSDAVIETCLKGMGVEIWDWKRYDICPEVILKVAPDVQVVHLYWAGNNAVLRAWSEAEGLKKLTKLKKVLLHSQQGLETRARYIKNVNDFVKRMAPIEVVELKMKGAEADSTSGGLDTVIDPYERHKWVTSMEEYASFLQTAERVWQGERGDHMEGGDQASALRQPVTVALIDDGVDVNDPAIQSRIVGGRSFCHRDAAQNLNQPYYVSGGGHGTAMAALICKVCPNVRLFILRLDEHFNELGKRQITAKSAAKAVRAAIEKQVDVISMSWTIEKTDTNGGDIKILEEAVSAAAGQNILMFCAATDQGAYRDRTYPAATATKNLFKIGAAEASGAALKWLGDQTLVDFIFPGHQVVMEQHNDPRVKKYTALTGSSIATALASGLAAVILYTVQLAEVYRNSSDLQQYRSLKDHDRMREAFSQIGTSKESENKYILVWNRFTRVVKQADRDSRLKDEWIELIGTLSDDLLRRA